MALNFSFHLPQILNLDFCLLNKLKDLSELTEEPDSREAPHSQELLNSTELKIASIMAETNFTLGPTSKTNKFPVLMVIICPELAGFK